MKTNLMHYLPSVYFVYQPLHVSGIFVTHHQEVYTIKTTNWNVLCLSVDCLLAGRPTDSQLKGTTRMYRYARSAKHKKTLNVCVCMCAFHNSVDSENMKF